MTPPTIRRQGFGPVLLPAVAAALFATRAWGGYAVDIRLLDRSTASPATYRTRMLLDTDAFNVDTTALQGHPSSLLCRRNDAVYLLDARAKTYLAVNLATLSGASAMAKQAEAMLPPALGAVLAGGHPAGSTAVQATDRRQTISGLACQLYVVTQGGVTIQEFWVAPWDQVKLPRHDFDLVKSVAASWSGLASMLNAGGGAASTPAIPTDGLLKIEGYPILFTQYGAGRPIYEARFGLPAPANTRAADFAVPSTYKRSYQIPGGN